MAVGRLRWLTPIAEHGQGAQTRQHLCNRSRSAALQRDSGFPGRLVLTGPLDLTALVLSESGVVSGDADMVFFNQPRGSGVVLEGRTLVLDLGSLRPGATRVALVTKSCVQRTRVL